MSAPLDGLRVLVTRAPHQAAELSRALRALGAVPVEIPALEIAPPENYTSLDAALQILHSAQGASGDRASAEGGFDWIIFTSANAVRAFVARSAALGLAPLGGSAPDPGPPAASQSPSAAVGQTPSVAVIGRATADAARDAGFAVTLVPEQAVAESLAAALAPRVSGSRVLLVRAAVARDILPETLRAAGANLMIAEAYRNLIPDASIPLLARALEQGIDAATFTSSSSVTHLAALARAAALPFPLPRVAAISIGPITSATLREHNWPPAAEAATADILSLVAAVRSLRANAASSE